VKEIFLAVKIVRQPRKIALIGAPTSAAALAGGHERGPAALRAAGLVDRLQAAGFEVTDLGDCATQVFHPDDEHPRARNIPAVVAALNDLKPRVEQAVKSGALPLILGGDCSIILGTVAGARRYYRHVGVIYVDRDADMNVPATTPSGCVDGMVVSHLVGRGAPELVRFWGEPPLVREPDIVLFGIERLDPPERIALERSPIRRYLTEDIHRKGVVAAAEDAASRMQGGQHEFVLHFDVDVISSDDFRATNHAATGGLSIGETQQALAVFAARENMIALEITAFNPAFDHDGKAAKELIELIAGMLTVRLASLESPAQLAAEANAPAESAHEEPRPSERQTSDAQVAPARTEPSMPNDSDETPSNDQSGSGETGSSGA
jgi:arginase